MRFVPLLAVILVTSCQTLSDRPPPVVGADADTALVSFERAYLAGSPGKRYFKANTEGGAADFWKAAEMIEMVEDAWDRTHDPAYKNLVIELYDGFVDNLGKRWIGNKYNDDLMWMILACLRAYTITGEPRFLETARYHFDVVWTRGWDQALGGGLYWTTDKVEKNTCIAMPAVLAAVRLADALGDPSYRARAEGLFAWQKKTLFNAETGQVYDNISWYGDVDPSAYTYNQGTFIGACAALGDGVAGRKALDYTVRAMTTDGILGETGGGDGAGFKGIFARWAWPFVVGQGLEDHYGSWFRRNIDTAWGHRDRDRNLVHQAWAEPTGTGPLDSWGTSAAVVWLQVIPPTKK